MSSLRDENYTSIQGWMINKLNLKGNELIVYAIIYGFSQAEEQVFNGGLKYLAEWTNSTKQGVMKNLKSLVEKGYICKRENYINGVKFCEYYATELDGVLNKVQRGIKQSLTDGGKQSLTNNKEEILNININSKEKGNRFAPPTIEEVKEYCKERNNNIDAEYFIAYYTARDWVLSNGKKMKDWKSSIITWEKRDFNDRKPKQDESRFCKNESTLEYPF